MLNIQFAVNKEKIKNNWFLKYRKTPEESIYTETENFCHEIEEKWKEKEVLICSACKNITGIEFQGDFLIFVFHPDLEIAEYVDTQTVKWGYRELYSNYIVIGIAHELLHCVTHDFYTKLDDGGKWLFHSLVYLSIDEELRFILNGKDEYFSSPIINTYHKKLISTAKKILSKWKKYMVDANPKNIIDFYKQISSEKG
jgi:hypothetical protein